MTTLVQQMNEAGKQISNQTPNFKEFRIMYFFGVWHTARRIAAETKDEAIFDADAYYRDEARATDKLYYALWCGNRLVKAYNFTPCDRFRMYRGK